MLVASHSFFSTIPAPFSAAGWVQADDSTFGTSNVNAVTASDSLNYVAVGNQGKIAYSSDGGAVWTAATSPFAESNLYAVAYGDGKYVAGGSTGKVATSTDGQNWTLYSSGFGASPVLGITYFDIANLWIAVGGSGKLATSTNGTTWTLRTSSFSTTFINSVYSSTSLAVAVGYDGKLATSTNGVDWTQRNSSFVFDTIFDVTYNQINDLYVAVGDFGKAATSTDALSWTQVFPNTSFGSSSIKTISTSGDFYVAGGSLGKIATSTNANSWIQRTSSFETTTVNQIYATDTTAVAVGDEGKIAYSV